VSIFCKSDEKGNLSESLFLIITVSPLVGYNKGPNFFCSAAEFFVHVSRRFLQRLGHTAGRREGGGCRQFFSIFFYTAIKKPVMIDEKCLLIYEDTARICDNYFIDILFSLGRIGEE
jgi:hypothetical protein